MSHIERREYKELLHNKWLEFSRSDDFKSIMNELSFNNYKVEIGKISRKDEIINLLNDSYNTKIWITALFGPAKQTTNIINSIENGRCFIIVDRKKDEIVGCTIVDDLLDHKNVGDSRDNYIDDIAAHKHIIEIVTDSSQKIYDFVVDKIGGEKNLKYGLCLFHGGSCTKYNLHNTGFSFIYSLITYFVTEYTGYKILVGDAVNVKMKNIAKSFGAYFIHETDFSNHVFKDGTDINTYFVKYKLRNPKTDIQQFKNQCKTAAIYRSSYYPAINPTLKITINHYKMMTKMVKEKRNERSKL